MLRFEKGWGGAGGLGWSVLVCLFTSRLKDLIVGMEGQDCPSDAELKKNTPDEARGCRRLVLRFGKGREGGGGLVGLGLSLGHRWRRRFVALVTYQMQMFILSQAK